MHKAGVKIDITRNEITIHGDNLKICGSLSGHYILPIGNVITDSNEDKCCTHDYERFKVGGMSDDKCLQKQRSR